MKQQAMNDKAAHKPSDEKYNPGKYKFLVHAPPFLLLGAVHGRRTPADVKAYAGAAAAQVLRGN